jgi:histidyl-tRNA synthetase
LDGVASTVSAGGRYDTLLGAPAVGISVGISRLASYLPPPTDSWKESYYITTIGNVSLYDKMKILQKIKSQTDRPILYNFTKDDKKLGKVITECITSYIRYVIIVGEDEFKDGKYILKDLKEKTQITKSIDLF